LQYKALQIALSQMAESVTTSIRLTPKLRRALELKAQKEKRGKKAE